MKTPKSILATLIAIMVLLLFSECFKKGKDDPLISFKTRKARLAGKWHMVSGSASRYLNSFYVDTKYTKDKYIDTYRSPDTVIVGDARFDLEFTKDGRVTWDAILDYTGLSHLEGNWDFGNGFGKAKKKETLHVHDPRNISYPTAYMFYIKELRDKKLVIFSEDKYSSYEYVFEKN